MNKNIRTVETDIISSNSDVFLLSEYSLTKDESIYLFKINPFNKKTRTKIKTENHANSEYCIKKLDTDDQDLTNDFQKKILNLNKDENFYLNERSCETENSNKINDFDYSKKQIYEVKPQQNDSNLISDLKKDFERNLNDINSINDKKIEDTNRFIMKKFDEFDKQIKSTINEKIKENDDKIIKIVDESQNKKLEQFKNNLLRS